MARTLVIGGTLFIGRSLVEQLLARGDEVVVMHRGHGTPFGGRVTELRCDRNDVAAVRAALGGERFDVIYDNVYDWERGTSPEPVVAAATSGDVGRYVFTSSVAVYPPGGEYDEDARLVSSDNQNAYGAQKAETERALFKLHRGRSAAVTTLRPAFIYGPNNPFDREAYFWDRIRAGRPIIIPGDGERTMQFVHVDDVATAAIRAAERAVAAGRAYNLAGEPITQIEFVRLLARVAGREAQLVHVPRERIQAAGGNAYAAPLYFGVYLDIPPITVRSDRVREQLGFALRPLEEGFRDAYRWYERQQRPAPDVSWEERLIALAQP